MFEIITWIGAIILVIGGLSLNASEQKQYARRKAALKGWETRRARQAADHG